MTEALNRLPKIAIGKYGQVQEWIEDFEENEVTHRHLSHLYGLYPSDDFTVDGLTPEMKKPVRQRLSGVEMMGWHGAGHGKSHCGADLEIQKKQEKKFFVIFSLQIPKMPKRFPIPMEEFTKICLQPDRFRLMDVWALPPELWKC